MRLVSSIAVFVLVLLACVVVPMPVDAGARSSDHPVEGWEIETMHNPIGRMSWYVSPAGAKLVSAITSVIVVPPDARLIVFNPDKKNYVVSTENDAIKHTMMTYLTQLSERKYKWVNWKKLGEQKKSGLTALHYKRSMLNPPIDKGTKRTSTFEDEVWVTQVDAAKDIQKYLKPISQIFSWDMPLDSVNIDRVSTWTVYQDGKLKKKDPKQEVSLISAKKRMFTHKDFAVPPGYARSQSLSEVMPDQMTFGFPR